MGDNSHKDYSVNLGYVVQTRADPSKRGMVKIVIPGKIDEPKWAEVCMPGSPFNNGIFVVPALNSSVVIQFVDGERDFPIVMGGTCPKAGPGGSRAATRVDDLPDMITMENGDWTLVMGKRGSNAPFFELKSRLRSDSVVSPEGGLEVIADPSQMRIVLDYDSQIMEVDIPQAISLSSPGLIRINGRLMTLRGRPVQEGSDPI